MKLSIMWLCVLCAFATLVACTAFPDVPTCAESSDCGEGFRCEAALCIPRVPDAGAIDADPEDATVSLDGAASSDVGLDTGNADADIDLDLGNLSDVAVDMDGPCTPEQLGDVSFTGSLEKPSSSCRRLHTDYPCLPTGTYWMQYGANVLRPTLCDMDTLGGGWEAMPMPLQAEDRCTAAPQMAIEAGCTSRSVARGQQEERYALAGLYSREMVGSTPYGPIGEFLGLEIDCRPVNQGRYVCPTPTSTYVNLTGAVRGRNRRESRNVSGARFLREAEANQRIQVLDEPLDTVTNLVIGMDYNCPPPAGFNTDDNLSELEVECRLRAHGGPGGGYLLIRPTCLVDAHCEDDFICQAQICTPPPPPEPMTDAGVLDDAGMAGQDVGGMP